ncbi:MAG: hypothetical protein NWF05_10395 [Candidatus Bathyarchaeota archaeon]|nr:hypothetical protein [Candidatus Bathyarchaeota archaeon]
MSSQNEKSIQTLMRLGLTNYQGRVFMALEVLGTSVIKEISFWSGVPRSKVYEALDGLTKMGLVNKVITAPTAFEAIPLCDAFSLLLERKIEDYRDLRVETSSMLDDFNQKRLNSENKKTSNITLISDIGSIIRLTKRNIESTETRIDMVVSWKKFLQRSPLLSEEVFRAYNRGVRMRFAIQRPNNEASLKAGIKSVGFPDSIEYRFFPFTPPAMCTLFDNKRVKIPTGIENGAKPVSAVFTDNACFVKIAKAYFNRIWTTSKPYDEKPRRNDKPSLNTT